MHEASRMYISQVHWVFSLNAGHAGSTFLGNLSNYRTGSEGEGLCGIFEGGHSFRDSVVCKDSPPPQHGCGIAGWWKGVVLAADTETDNDDNAWAWEIKRRNKEVTTEVSAAEEKKAAADLFVERCMLPVYLRQLRACQGDHATLPGTFLDIGHHVLFGLLYPLIDFLPHVTVVRIRRPRVMNAMSYFEEGKIPCNGRGMFVLCPWWHDAVLRPTQDQWEQLSGFQRCLWMIDEVEARWQLLRKRRPEAVGPALNWTDGDSIQDARQVIAGLLSGRPSAGPIDKQRQHLDAEWEEKHQDLLESIPELLEDYDHKMNFTSRQRRMISEQQF